MAVVADQAFIIGEFGETTLEPTGAIQPYQGMGYATVGPGYRVPANGFGAHVAQRATVVDPRTGYARPTSLPSSAGLGLITESDAWLTGRTTGLPGTATVQYANGRASMLGAASIEPGYSVSPGFGLISNEIQRQLSDPPSTSLFDKPGAKAVLGAIAGTLLIGLIGVIANAGD